MAVASFGVFAEDEVWAFVYLTSDGQLRMPYRQGN
jgi:hypothetical protein